MQRTLASLALAELPYGPLNESIYKTQIFPALVHAFKEFLRAEEDAHASDQRLNEGKKALDAVVLPLRRFGEAAVSLSDKFVMLLNFGHWKIETLEASVDSLQTSLAENFAPALDNAKKFFQRHESNISNIVHTYQTQYNTYKQNCETWRKYLLEDIKTYLNVPDTQKQQKIEILKRGIQKSYQSFQLRSRYGIIFGNSILYAEPQWFQNGNVGAQELSLLMEPPAGTTPNINVVDRTSSSKKYLQDEVLIYSYLSIYANTKAYSQSQSQDGGKRSKGKGKGNERPPPTPRGKARTRLVGKKK